jgi:Putative transmembrane protein (PGPGW)
MTQTAIHPQTESTGSTRCPDCTDGLGQPRPVKPGSFRERMHSSSTLLLSWRIAVFVAGLLFMVLGIALTALPGPLTIPPVLIGLWIWSTEFQWAARFFAVFKGKAQDAWRHAKQHPVSSVAITVGGLAAAGVAFWAVEHFQLVDQAKVALGL